MVIIHLQKCRFPKAIYHKLKLKKIDPCKVLKKSNDNAYRVEFLNDFAISLVLNISYFFLCLYIYVDGELQDTIDWAHHIPKKRIASHMYLIKRSLAPNMGATIGTDLVGMTTIIS